MLLSELLDLDKLQEEVWKRYVSVRAHPLDPTLRIFNYTHEAAYAGEWTHEQKVCRGLIVRTNTRDGDALVVARPFPKFFNYGEHILNHEDIPLDEPFEVTSKEDGSLGILYTAPDGLPAIATRGSFESDQATWATRHLRASVRSPVTSDGEVTRLFGEGVTVLFEILAPWNRIVLDYGSFEGLVLLAVLDNETGRPLDLQALQEQAPPHDGVRSGVRQLSPHKDLGFWSGPVVESHQFDQLEDLLGHVEASPGTNQEGFVIYFPESNFRVKVKFAEYVKLHRILTGLSERRIWEHISQGGSIEDFIEGVPDEFFDWVRAVDNRLRSEHRDIILRVHLKAARLSDPEWEFSRKEIAQQIEDDPDRGLIFLALDEKFNRLHESVWALLRPAGNVTFRDDDDS